MDDCEGMYRAWYMARRHLDGEVDESLFTPAQLLMARATGEGVLALYRTTAIRERTVWCPQGDSNP